MNKVIVVGDVMLDLYWHGEVNRISPEAPVPVLNYQSEEARLGGSANVAANIVAQGHNCLLIGICGEDERANQLQQLLEKFNIQYDLAKGGSTITKLRLLQQTQQIVRVDREKKFPSQTIQQVLKVFSEKMHKSEEVKDIHSVVLSDYAKGSIADPQPFIQKARSLDIPIIIDPKGNDYHKYRDSFCLTPNEKEFKAVVGDVDNEQKFEQKMGALVRQLNLSALLVTRGEKGISLWCNNYYQRFATQAQKVYDVCGAGDTVIATLSAHLQIDKPYSTTKQTLDSLLEVVQLANRAASLAVAKLGTATISADDLSMGAMGASKRLCRTGLADWLAKVRQENATIAFTNGCFDILHKGHIHCLQEAAKTADKLIVAVNVDESVTRLKGASRPINSLSDRIEVLSALNCVDAIIPFAGEAAEKDTPLQLIKAIEPDVLVKGSDYEVDAIVGAEILKKYGGKVHLVKYQQGYSTTSLIEGIKKESL